ncbi:hypothetical protein NEFER03_1393 [Nematocida sp. LUAm3]|nr:hypothetical protein NEFER03_1393 [Nematocida sp. LUAm3]KAI5174777.1 hypothetical protein NEFER02_0887 [Nematocida sp. LUAm2]KAI5177812.1 hypothetical protein NEFER01_1014 [Nematocida sp. LUAm1]
MNREEEKNFEEEREKDLLDDVEYENMPVIPKTPQKKNKVRHLENIETPFKMKLRRTEIKGIQVREDNKLLKAFQETESMDEERMWFMKKKLGRKRKPFKLIRTKAHRVIRTEKQVCPVENYFISHFQISETHYTSQGSFVYFVSKKSSCPLSGPFSSLCTYCMPNELDLPMDPHECSVVKVSRMKWSTLKEKKARVKEAKFLNRLRRCKYIPNIIRAWEESSVLYMEMELCNEGTLKNYLRAHINLSEKMKYSIILQITKGLRAIHSSKIIHLDIKPENIYLHTEKEVLIVKIGDFGISRSFEDATEIEYDGDRLYMAPELLQNICSPASDIYSLGLLFIEILFKVGAPLKSIQWTEIPLGKKQEIILNANITMGAYELIKQMISADPLKRPGIDEVLKAIRAGIFMTK